MGEKKLVNYLFNFFSHIEQLFELLISAEFKLGSLDYRVYVHHGPVLNMHFN